MSELIVVTLVVAAEGGSKIPKVSDREELKSALNKLGALRSEQVCLSTSAHHSSEHWPLDAACI